MIIDDRLAGLLPWLGERWASPRSRCLPVGLRGTPGFGLVGFSNSKGWGGRGRRRSAMACPASWAIDSDWQLLVFFSGPAMRAFFGTIRH